MEPGIWFRISDLSTSSNFPSPRSTHVLTFQNDSRCWLTLKMCADHLFLLASATLHIWFQILEPTSSAVASLHCSKQTSLFAYLVNGFSDSWTLLHPPGPHHVGNSLVIKMPAPLPLLESFLFSGLIPKSCLLSSCSFLKPIWASATLSLLSHSSYLELTGTPSSGVRFVTLALFLHRLWFY